MPHVSRDTAEPAARPPPHTHARRLRTRTLAHRHRRAARPGGAALVHPPSHAFHDVLSHAVPAVRARATARSHVVVLCVPALVPPAGAAYARRDGVDAARSRRERLR